MTTNEISTETTETAAVAEQGAQAAPETTTSTKKASQKKGAPKAKKGAKGATKKAAAKTDAKPASNKAAKKETKPAAKKPAKQKNNAPREGSKKEAVLALLAHKGGATLGEIADATGWQNHSIRGFISGQLTKKMGLVVESTRNEQGARTYRITK